VGVVGPCTILPLSPHTCFSTPMSRPLHSSPVAVETLHNGPLQRAQVWISHEPDSLDLWGIPPLLSARLTAFGDFERSYFFLETLERPRKSLVFPFHKPISGPILLPDLGTRNLLLIDSIWKHNDCKQTQHSSRFLSPACPRAAPRRDPMRHRLGARARFLLIARRTYYSEPALFSHLECLLWSWTATSPDQYHQPLVYVGLLLAVGGTVTKNTMAHQYIPPSHLLTDWSN
jgi:hypothetical protein